MGSVSSEVQTQELAAKISENEQLHLKVWSTLHNHPHTHCCAHFYCMCMYDCV